ncbi:MAG: hypothetical protein N2247_11095 [Leptospiraceae bacterium]|jgi:hypothetical protein|nr:hypothetical protein [Leptospiraceae bacterium]
MRRFFQFILSLIIVLIFLGIGLIAPIFYIYQSGKDFIQEVQQQTRNRAQEIAIALDTMSGESIYYDNMISLSNVMAKIKEHTNIRNDPYKIQEIFLLDSKNLLLAHNDILKVAKDFQPNYDPKKYRLGQLLFYGNPVAIEITNYAEVQLPPELKKLDSFLFFINIENTINSYLKKYLPDLLANQFHVYTSVYPPDEILPKASLHILIENTGIVPLVSYWIKQMFYVWLFSSAVFVVLFLYFMILLYVLLKKPKQDFIDTVQIEKEAILPEDELNLDNVDIDFDLKELPVQDKKEKQSDDVLSDEEIQLDSQEFPDQDKKMQSKNVVFMQEYQKNKNLKEQKNTQNIAKDFENIIDALPLD